MRILLFSEVTLFKYNVSTILLPIVGTLTVGDTSVAIVNKARNLGVWFDSQLNFNVHITKTCSLSFCSLYKIRRIRKYLSYKSAQEH